MTLTLKEKWQFQVISFQVKRIKRDIKKVLDKREQEWHDQEKKLKKNKVEELVEKGKHRDARFLQNISHGLVLSNVLMT